MRKGLHTTVDVDDEVVIFESFLDLDLTIDHLTQNWITSIVVDHFHCEFSTHWISYCVDYPWCALADLCEDFVADPFDFYAVVQEHRSDLKFKQYIYLIVNSAKIMIIVSYGEIIAR